MVALVGGNVVASVPLVVEGLAAFDELMSVGSCGLLIRCFHFGCIAIRRRAAEPTAG